MLRTPAAFVALLATGLAAAACSSGSGSGSSHFTTPIAVASATPAATSSPSAAPSAPASASPTASSSGGAKPPAITGAYGVLAGPFTGATYNVTLVGVDGTIAASTQASTPAFPACGQASGDVPYPVSASNTAAYYMDGAGAVRWMSPKGITSTSPVITLPVGPSTRSVFAVSPDDARIAVAVIDFSSGGATTRLFVDNLTLGGAHNEIFSESGQFTLWPIGWHAGNLVVAKVASCTNGIGPIWSSQVELHVVDPATAARKYTLGGSGCAILGPASPGGVICRAGNVGHEIDWTGKTFASFDSDGTESFLSPDAKTVAISNPNATNLSYTLINGMQACVFIDNSHLLSGGDAQSQPKVAVPNGSITPVSAIGDCAGRIPGGL